MNRSPSKKASLQGLLTPLRWDSEGNILEVQLSLPKEVNVQFQDNPLATELCLYSGAVVKLLGWQTASEFFIEDYKIIKPYSGKKLTNQTNKKKEKKNG